MSERPPSEPLDFASVVSSALSRMRAYQESPEGKAQARSVAAFAAARRRRELLELAAERGVPQHPWLLEVVASEAPSVTPALAVLEESLAWREAQRRPGLPQSPLTVVLAGTPGCGKSTALARTVARWPRPARMVLAREVAALSESGWSESVEARARLVSVPLLAVDEAGLEEHDRAGARVGAILGERASGALVTLVATNLDAEAFVARYLTDRLRSRLSVEQGRRGCPWWRDLPSLDLRDPGALEAAG